MVTLVKHLQSRRTVTAWLAIMCLTLIALKTGTDTSIAIATVAVGLAGANSFQKKGSAPNE